MYSLILYGDTQYHENQSGIYDFLNEMISNFSGADEIIKTNDANEFFQSSSKKVSFFVVPQEILLAFTTKNLSITYIQNIINIVQNSDASLFAFTEMCSHNLHILDALDNIQNKNIIIFMPGFANNRQYQNIKIIYNPIWMFVSKITAVHSDELRDKIYQLNAYEPKPKLVEILLGTGGIHKPHRNFVFEMVNNSVLKDKVIMNFRNPDYPNSNDNFFLDEDNIEHLPYDHSEFGQYHSTRPIKSYGILTTVASVLPLNIWRQTAYSVVAETQYDNELTFFSEKTFKPMLARRLFIMFAGQYYLKNLRSLGFKTFDGIIDETYDTVADPYIRWALAFNQLLWLETQPQHEIFERIKRIVEHNFELAFDMSWHSAENTAIELLMKPFIP
jgi:hypothetical protein